MGYSGMGVFWRQPERFFCGIVQFEHPHRRYPKTALLAYRVQRYGRLGRHPSTQTFFGSMQFKHYHHRYPKTALLASGVQRYGCLGRHPRTQTIFLALCSSNTPTIGTQKHFCWPMGYSEMGVWGATPEPGSVFGIVQFKQPDPGYPTAPLLTYRVQSYGCLGRHPRTQTIMFGIV